MVMLNVSYTPFCWTKHVLVSLAFKKLPFNNFRASGFVKSYIKFLVLMRNSHSIEANFKSNLILSYLS